MQYKRTPGENYLTVPSSSVAIFFFLSKQKKDNFQQYIFLMEEEITRYFNLTLF